MIRRPDNPADRPLFAWRETFFALCREHEVAPRRRACSSPCRRRRRRRGDEHEQPGQRREERRRGRSNDPERVLAGREGSRSDFRRLSLPVTRPPIPPLRLCALVVFPRSDMLKNGILNPQINVAARARAAHEHAGDRRPRVSVLAGRRDDRHFARRRRADRARRGAGGAAQLRRRQGVDGRGVSQAQRRQHASARLPRRSTA